MEFLTHSIIRLPDGISSESREALIQEERDVGRELVAAGHLLRIWRIPGQWANVALWSAADATELHDSLVRLPLYPHMTTEVLALAIHPLEAAAAADPATRKRN